MDRHSGDAQSPKAFPFVRFSQRSAHFCPFRHGLAQIAAPERRPLMSDVGNPREIEQLSGRPVGMNRAEFSCAAAS